MEETDLKGPLPPGDPLLSCSGRCGGGGIILIVSQRNIDSEPSRSGGGGGSRRLKVGVIAK